MSDSVNGMKISLPLTSSAAEETAAAAFLPEQSLKLVVNRSSEFKLAETEQSATPKLHHEARKLVFERIVNSHLNNPNHPYYPLVSQAMVDSITDALASSHYFRQELKRS